jgi:hypothetical protein
MLQLRVEGELAEARAFLDALAGAGAEVQVGTAKDRGEFHHVYAVIRMPGYTPPAGDVGPVRAQATVVRPPLAGGRRQLRGRRR